MLKVFPPFNFSAFPSQNLCVFLTSRTCYSSKIPIYAQNLDRGYIKLFIYWNHMLNMHVALQSNFLKNMLLACFMHFFIPNKLFFWPGFLKNNLLQKKNRLAKKRQDGKLESIFKWSFTSPFLTYFLVHYYLFVFLRFFFLPFKPI